MKIRHGFVSNSSSSSFMIPLSALTGTQVEQIRNHEKLGAEMGIPWAGDPSWSITIDPHTVRGSTWMDNFDMYTFLEKIGVNMDYVHIAKMG